MKQIDILRRLVTTPNIYPTESAREVAKKNLFMKQKRRAYKQMKRNQTKINFDTITTIGNEVQYI
ncbi:MAG TPA: hypothetical protein VIM65_01280 [Cyclobacteriaceae bacterium]